MKSNTQKIIISGAGPVGVMLAIMLAKKDYQIEIVEKRQDPFLHTKDEGRSINLALSVRGLDALEKVGLAEELLTHAVPMKGRMIHNKDKSTHFIPYSPNQEKAIYSISRIELTKLLLKKAGAFKNIKISFEEECLGVDIKSNTVFLKNRQTNRSHKKPFDLLFDCEGANSSVRTSLLKFPYTNFTQNYLSYDYIEIAVPPKNNNYALSPEALHIWPRGHFLLIALPNPNFAFTGTLFLPHSGDNSFQNLKTPKDIKRFFENELPDFYSLVPGVEKTLFEKPIGHLVTINISPWNFHNKVLLLGDAAHAVVPFYGQGLNCGFEDCVILNKIIDKLENWSQILETYEKERKISADAISELSIDNFIELREKVADPIFVLKRELETLLEQKFPNEFRSKYSMVTFSHIPYEEALKKGRKQDKILMDICSKVTKIDEINLYELITKININE